MTDDPDPGPVPDPPAGSPGAAQVAAVAHALPILALAERGDPDALALALSDAVRDPESAGALAYGLIEVARFMLGQPALYGSERLEALEGMLVDLAMAQ